MLALVEGFQDCAGPLAGALVSHGMDGGPLTAVSRKPMPTERYQRSGCFDTKGLGKVGRSGAHARARAPSPPVSLGSSSWRLEFIEFAFDFVFLPADAANDNMIVVRRAA